MQLLSEQRVGVVLCGKRESPPDLTQITSHREDYFSPLQTQEEDSCMPTRTS
jgi:hypothetical protein